MGLFKTPEIPGEMGFLDDLAFADGEPVSAHVVRQLLKNGNRQVAKGHLMFRWVASPRAASTTVTTGGAVSFGTPFWTHVIPAYGIPVIKKPGITKMRLKIRFSADSARTLQFYPLTSVTPDPYVVGAVTDYLTLTGNGLASIQTATMTDIPVRKEEGDFLNFLLKADINPGDPVLDTTTYGGNFTGTVDLNSTLNDFEDDGLGASGWKNSGSDQVHTGGHYVYFVDPTNETTRRHGPAQIIDVGEDNGSGRTDRLYFYPPAPNQQAIRGSKYYIRKLPSFTLISIACYAQEASASDYGFR